MFKFKLSYVALATALTSTCVLADPTIYLHHSGATVVDIEAPNAAGVSHNMYREFNVNNKGLILNNSGADVTHSTLGGIAKNNNLTNGGASVILNEVISNKSSSLNGFIEVNGQKADVVIANPNGISCSGCNFINANKVVMTTGNVNLDSTGAIASYNVTGGKISVDAYGMYANDNYVALLADTINLNGMVNAKNATISTGNFTFDNTTGSVTSHGKTANLLQTIIPEYSLDVSSLGGVKAGSITMVGNNLGFGVRNKGSIVANTSLAMASNGSLINEGSITNNGYVAQIASAGTLKNSGTISTKNIAMISSNGELNNSGTIANSSQMSITTGGNIENTGTIKASENLVVATNGNLKTTYGSMLSSDNTLSVTAIGNITNGGSTHAKDTTVLFGGDKLTVTGNIHGTDNLLIKSSNGGVTRNGAIVNEGKIAGDTIEIATNGNIKNAKNGVISAGKSMKTRSYSLDNAGYIDANYASVFIDNYSTTNSGSIVGYNLEFLTWFDMLNESIIQAHGDLKINTQKNGKFINRGGVYAGYTMTLAAKQVVNGGYSCGLFRTCGVGSLNAQKLILNSTHKYASNMGGTQNFKSTEIITYK
ncbi:filamentous hemagglutinin N-terminal domain-containing protein [Leclercia sp.]|uniref:filamentous hemagglutinin N-terminal domain-containing protein n=1 Tax=Leclercia sp. TaxID=1898428 RepID=UPI002FDE71CA